MTALKMLLVLMLFK